jgi:DNA-formamidopyrimidine glycosylase
MPEGPEVRIIAEQWKSALGKKIIKVDHTRNKKYKWERDGIPGWDKIGPGWEVTNMTVKGKLIRVDFKKNDKSVSMLNTLGLEGFWSWDKSLKHRRVWFQFEHGKLFYVDSRNFGTIRFMSSEDADKKMDKIGWDLLLSPMPDANWNALQSKKTLAKKSIGEVLMKQNHFAGIGNIYKAEALYELKIKPTLLVEEIDPEVWNRLNYAVHRILFQSYLAKGSSVKSYSGGEFQRELKIYKKKTCPSGHKVASLEQSKRTTWYCPTCQP